MKILENTKYLLKSKEVKRREIKNKEHEVKRKQRTGWQPKLLQDTVYACKK